MSVLTFFPLLSIILELNTEGIHTENFWGHGFCSVRLLEMISKWHDRLLFSITFWKTCCCQVGFPEKPLLQEINFHRTRRTVTSSCRCLPINEDNSGVESRGPDGLLGPPGSGKGLLCSTRIRLSWAPPTVLHNRTAWLWAGGLLAPEQEGSPCAAAEP